MPAMMWVPQFLGGPVLHWELVRAARKPWVRSLGMLYGVWLWGQFILLAPPPVPTYQATWNYQTWWDYQTWSNQTWWDYQDRLEFLRQEQIARTVYASGYVSTLLHQQLILIAFLTPALAAAALGYEKQNNTLMALFGTDLTDREVVLGKLLGRLAVLGLVLLTALPLVVIMATIGDVSVLRILMALAQAAALIMALAGIAMLASVWAKRTADAILACYAAIIIVYLALEIFLVSFPLPSWLEVLDILRQLMTPQVQLDEPWLIRYFCHLAAYAGVGVACLALARRSLRGACLREFDRRPPRWLWSFRPAVGDSPIRWRERYVIGLAPIPWLRFIPDYITKVAVFTFSSILAFSALDNLSGRMLIPLLRTAHFQLAYQALGGSNNPTRLTLEVCAMGGVLLLIGTIVVAVRCANSIREEKQRQTWEDLVLTPLTMEEIVNDKRSGILQAGVSYLILYALPMLALSTLGGGTGLFVAGSWIGCAVACMLLAAHFGMALSGSGAQGDGPGQIASEEADESVIEISID
jgi:hypothetical protein